MATPEARIVLLSESPDGNPIFTVQVKAHRFILAEINTHRVLSRNYRSSRAVPSEKLIEEVETQPAMPVFWGANQAGMQAAMELEGEQLVKVKDLWHQAAKSAATYAELLARAGLHKQLANRVLEPFMWTHGVLTSTEWDNFFGLRLHRDAQPEFRVLADAIWQAMKTAEPKYVDYGHWHLPYVREEDWRIAIEKAAELQLDTVKDLIIPCSVARCARVSYRPFDAYRPSNLVEDRQLYRRLVGSQPMHASPAEHQATPDRPDNEGWTGTDLWGNFTGWQQFRKTIKGEAVAPLPEEYKN